VHPKAYFPIVGTLCLFRGHHVHSFIFFCHKFHRHSAHYRPVGLSGKDVILGVMRQLKRNTVAADRLVEYTGDGLRYLSSDARFAIANMTTNSVGSGPVSYLTPSRNSISSDGRARNTHPTACILDLTRMRDTPLRMILT
jgi:hypothetical protein